MANTSPSTYMSLPVPVVGVDPGPEYATDVNTCLNIVDLHNHSPGYGVQITPSGLNISTDLTFNGNNAITLRSSRYVAQSSPLSLPTDLGCSYVSGVDLYFNDGSGNQIRITQSGAVAGTPGSISNLVTPASASYNSLNSTFVWQSNTNVAANMDAGFYIFRNNTANSKGLTLEAPNAMAADYTIVLPPLPSQQNFMLLDSSGNITAPWHLDNSTIVVSSNTIQVPTGGITSAQIADGSVITSKIADNNVTYPKLQTIIPTLSTLNNFTNQVSAGPTLIGNSSTTITTYNRPVIANINGGQFSIANGSGSSKYFEARFILYRNGSPIAHFPMLTSVIASGQSYTWNEITVTMFDTNPGAASNTYTLYWDFPSSDGSSSVSLSSTSVFSVFSI